MENTNQKLNILVKVALLGAISAILMFVEISIIPGFEWLKLDFSELPVLMGGFAFGPIVAIVIELIKIVVKVIYTGASSGYVGLLANFLIGSSFVVPAAFIYQRNKSKKSAIIGMVVGTVAMEVVAIFANLFILLPAYGMPMQGEAAVEYVLFGLLPLNSIKAISVSILTYIIYKKVSVAIFKVDANFGAKKKVKDN